MENNEQLLSAIFNVGRLIKEKIHSGKCLADFTYAEVEVLKFMHGKKKMTMKAIADYLHIKPSSATPLIDNLVKKGSLKRSQMKGDRRVVYIDLTPKGCMELQKKFKNIHKAIKQIFGKIKNNDKEILIKIFKKIHAENT